MGAGESGWSPVARFSVALALILAVTAGALAVGTAYFIGRYIEDETARFTEESVASHFGTVFDPAVFQRSLSEAERARLQQFVVFHLAIYDVVAAQFFTPDGTIVLSYDPSELGRRIDPARVAGLRGVYVRSSRQIVAQSLALTNALGETERAYDATLRALSNALDVRDSETEGHSLRVVEYMDLVARGLGFPAAELVTLRRGALLHDVGKIGVPDHILRKPAPLTDHEWTQMRRHPDHGARLFTVADAFDAMTSDRPYRRALTVAEAREEVRRSRGTQFDPRVVDAFLAIPVERLGAVGPAAVHLHPLAQPVASAS